MPKNGNIRPQNGQISLSNLWLTESNKIQPDTAHFRPTRTFQFSLFDHPQSAHAASQLVTRHLLNLQCCYTDFGHVTPFSLTMRYNAHVDHHLSTGVLPDHRAGTGGLVTEAAGADLKCSESQSISRLVAATSSRQLACCTLFTWDNGFNKAAVDSHMDVQTSIAAA